MDKLRILSLLNEDRIKNITLIQSIEKSNASIIYFDNCCVLLFDKVSKTMMLSSKTMKSTIKALDSLTQPYDFLMIQDEYSKIVQDRFNLIHSADYYQAVYISNRRIDSDKLEFQLVNEDDFDVVLKYYQTDNYTYLKQRCDSHQLWVGKCNKTIIGFIGIHDEGSIGLLYVRAEYRRMGYGEVLLEFMTNYFLENNWVPYSQISIDNTASIMLHKKVGYVLSETNVVWLQYIKED